MKNLFLASVSFILISTSVTHSQILNKLLSFGNVGIGTLSPSPSAVLDVRGNTLLQSFTATGTVFLKENTTLDKQLSVLGNTVLKNTRILGNFELPSLQITATPASGLEILLRDPITGTVSATSIQILDPIISPQPIVCPEGNIVAPRWASGTNKLFVRCPQVNVGIGTDSPTHNLHTVGPALFNSTVEIGQTLQVSESATVGFDLRVNRSVGIGVAPSTFSKFKIKTTSPGAAIEVDQMGNTNDFSKLLYFQYTNPTTEVLKVVNATNSANPVNSYLFEASGKMTVRDVNNRQIFQLNTDGLLRTRAVKVDLESSWPDYVFTPSYKLMPLAEVRSYIDANGHLPNIPSAKSVAEEGVNLGEMTKAMMEKIEEMTLYILEQQKELDAMKARINELESDK